MSGLAEQIQANASEILRRWEARVRPRPDTPEDRAELVDGIPMFLDALVRALRREGDDAGNHPAVFASAEEHGRQRQRLGVRINTIVAEYGALCDVLLEVAAEGGATVPVSDMRVLMHAFMTAIAEAVRHHGEAHASALRVREAQVQTIIDNSPAVIFAKDLDGRFMFVNGAFERLFDRSRHEVVGRTDHELFPRELADSYRENDCAALAHAAPIEREEHARVGDQERTYVSLKFPLFDENGQAYAVCGVSTDITQRLALEAERAKLFFAAQEARAQLEATLNSIPDALYVGDARGIHLANQAALEQLGFERPEDLARDVATLAKAIDTRRADTREPIPPHEQAFARALAGQPDVQEVVVRNVRTGLDRVVRSSCAPIRIGDKVVGAVAVNTDITDVKTREAERERLVGELEAERERLKVLLDIGHVLARETSMDAMLATVARVAVTFLGEDFLLDLLDDDGELHRTTVLACDPARQRLLERTRAFSPAATGEGPHARALRAGEPLAFEVEDAVLDRMARSPEHRAALAALGRRSIVIAPLIARGRRIGVMTIGSLEPGRMTRPDTLELVRGVADSAALAIDNARLLNEANEAAKAREQLGAIAAHDLRNPLNAIAMSVEVLTRRGQLADWQERGLARIRSSAQRANRLVADLLALAQAHTGALPIRRQPLDFHALAAGVVDEVAVATPTRAIEFQAEGDARGEYDPDRLAQMVANLVSNAVQHSPEGTPVRVSSQVQDGHLRFQVHNEGAPIPPDVLPELFEPYRRGPTPGSGAPGSMGLGLFVTKRIVEAHGGRIQVTSKAGEGTTFTVDLPRRPD